MKSGEHWKVLPSTQPGWISLWLGVAFAAWFIAFFLAAFGQLGPDGPEHFFDNLYLAIPLCLAASCAVGAGVLAAYAVFFRHERSPLSFGSMAFGVFVVVFTIGEIAGHGEPDGSEGSPPTPTSGVAGSPTSTAPAPSATSAANGHANVESVVNGPDQVRVSFDYSYNHDPDGTVISAITVSPLGPDQEPLAGYDPAVMPISRGSGHIDVTLTFTPEQLALLDRFSVCFTAPGHPDLGCSMSGYRQ